jgi:hypothetical protein
LYRLGGGLDGNHINAIRYYNFTIRSCLVDWLHTCRIGVFRIKGEKIMAFVYLKMAEDDQTGKDFIINTKNIKSIPVSVTRVSGIKVKTVFTGYFLDGKLFDFNQIYYQGKFIYVHNMKQLYSLLTKIEKGEE